MDDSPPKEPNHARSACTECQRRKQKCSREWPCNHCQKRKVADRCRFKDSNQPLTQKAFQENRRKRRIQVTTRSGSRGSDVGDADSDGIDALGYMPTHVLYGLTAQDEVVKASSREYIRDIRGCPQLARALQVIPPRHYTDTLVQNFLSNVNFHYYIVYPASFLEQYQQWWADKVENKPLGIQWTCLLLMVCACASQYTDVELQKKLETDLGDSVQRLTEKYHYAARELSSSIPIGYSHLTNVQALLHSCYWFKSETKFVECWHVLNSAIKEAQELGIHKESPDDPVSEFDLEIRRRVWCVLDTWDWKISALLGRPMIINRADCNVALPNLALEGLHHSPLAHMKLQSGLIRKLFARFGLTKNVRTPEDVQEYQAMIEAWIEEFPPPFDVYYPDKSLDRVCPWVVFHRHYLRTMIYSMLMDPIRAYLARPLAIDASETEFRIRGDGVNYCLELMVSLHGFFNHVYPRDAKFHFVLFCIFDTSTVLCSAIFHDGYHTLPRRDEVFRAIHEAHDMLFRLKTVTKSAKASYGILTRIMQRLPRTSLLQPVPELNLAKRPQISEEAFPAQTSPVYAGDDGVPQFQVSPPQSISPGYNMSRPFVVSPPQLLTPSSVSPPISDNPAEAPVIGTESPCLDGLVDPFVYLDWQPQPQETPFYEQPYQQDSFANISEDDLTELAMWNYASLDFSFITPSTTLQGNCPIFEH